MTEIMELSFAALDSRIASLNSLKRM